MNAGTLIGEAAVSLASAKMRSALAAFGIATGVGSVIAMMTIGEIVALQSKAELEGLGPDLVRLTVERGGARRGSAGRVGIEHVTDMAERVDGVRMAAASETVGGSVRYGNARVDSGWAVGVTGAYAAVARREVAEGRFVSDLDERLLHCTLGHRVAAMVRRVNAGAVLGEKVRINERLCTVVGVMAPARAHRMLGYGEPDNGIYIPLTAAMQMSEARGVGEIVLRVTPGVAPEVSAERAQAYLRAEAGGVEMRVESAKWLIEQMERQARLFRLLLGSIGGIALTVAGVGVMNLMLTAVAERRTEIGLRRAVGARRRDIRRQFIAEAVALCAVGGAAGIGVGIGCTWAICVATSLTFAVVPAPVWMGVTMATIVGVVFGAYPAQLAARVDRSGRGPSPTSTTVLPRRVPIRRPEMPIYLSLRHLSPVLVPFPTIIADNGVQYVSVWFFPCVIVYKRLARARPEVLDPPPPLRDRAASDGASGGRPPGKARNSIASPPRHKEITMKNALTTALAVAALAAGTLAGPAHAHHGWSELVAGEHGGHNWAKVKMKVCLRISSNAEVDAGNPGHDGVGIDVWYHNKDGVWVEWRNSGVLNGTWKSNARGGDRLEWSCMPADVEHWVREGHKAMSWWVWPTGRAQEGYKPAEFNLVKHLADHRTGGALCLEADHSRTMVKSWSIDRTLDDCSDDD